MKPVDMKVLLWQDQAAANEGTHRRRQEEKGGRG